MAKIDMSQVEGFSEMSAEEKLALYEAFEYDDGSAKYDALKKSFDKTSSELAEAKKQLKSKMSEDEVKAKESTEAFEKLQAEHNELLGKVRFSETTSQYLALGYDKELAENTAKAFIEGDMATVFANQKVFQDNIKKSVEADILRNTGRPQGGSGTKSITKAEFDSMGYAERLALKKSNPELYKQFNS